MDQAIANALRRREELKAELSDIEVFLRLYDRFGGRVDEPSRTEQAEPSESPNVVQPKEQREDHQTREFFQRSTTRVYGGRGTAPHLIAQRAMEILRREGKIVDRDDLVSMIESEGAIISSNNKSNYLLIILNRNVKGEFELHGRGIRSVPESMDLDLRKSYPPVQPPPMISDESPA